MGAMVEDPYLWLENIDDEAALDWVRARNDSTIAELLASKGLAPDSLVVELNLRIIRQEQWPEIRLKENDRLELLNFVGGG